MQPMEATRPSVAIDAIKCRCRIKPLMSIETVAELMDVSDDYLTLGLREGRFPGKRLGRLWRMPTDFVRGFIAAPPGTQFEDYAADWMAREAQAVAS